MIIEMFLLIHLPTHNSIQDYSVIVCKTLRRVEVCSPYQVSPQLILIVLVYQFLVKFVRTIRYCFPLLLVCPGLIQTTFYRGLKTFVRRFVIVSPTYTICFSFHDHMSMDLTLFFLVGL